MASLFRPSYTKPDPTTGGRVTRRVRKWYGKYRDAGGNLRCVPLCEHKTAAMAMLTDMVRKSHLQRAGLLDPAAEHLARPIEDHLADYRVHLDAKARSARYISETIRLVRLVASACGLKTLLELQNAEDQLERHLTNRRRAGVSHRTVNADLIAARSFCRWLIARRRMHDDPTRGLVRLNEDEDPRLERRALTDAEFERLYLAIYGSRRVVRRLRGSDRAILYLLAVRTGLRRGELRSLMPSSFDFSAQISLVTVRAAKSKRRRTDTLPLSPDVAATLQEYLVVPEKFFSR
ncbi:MAG: hypothetical protein WD738_22905 [Pirellulales bacterium]